MSWRVSLRQPIVTIFGANTDVGKTIFATLLTKNLAPTVSYIKPISTGPLSDADYLHVDRFTGIRGPRPPRDPDILNRLTDLIMDHTERPVIIETAGGVHSPMPSGTSQLDFYRRMRYPVILVADAKLGGISTTISAYESLRLHGFDVIACVGFRTEWGNLSYLSDKLPDLPIIEVPPPPIRHQETNEDAEILSVYYDLVSKSPPLVALRDTIFQRHKERLARLTEMPGQALQKLWYPFTQHAHLTPEDVTTIDSAIDDDFAVFDTKSKSLRPVFDGSASWWTQGLGHANPELALEAAYAASRYGHVILPSAVNEPALALAANLLETVGKGWASRVYYSDNGATAIEVALKMGLKASRVRYCDSKENLNLGIIGLKGSYHGDTIGAMDASDPNIYNDEVDWYKAKGLFFDPPNLIMQKGRWTLRLPTIAGIPGITTFETLQEVFDLCTREHSDIAKQYTTWIESTIQAAIHEGRRFGALLFEPVLLGAGGMTFVDPLFQSLLTTIVRKSANLCPPGSPSSWTGLPVITDEVFTGLYRLGVPRAAELLNINPDISANAKLLTGGAVPLAVTLASEDIFDVFFMDDKKDALLHGHSYTAHPIGTTVALKSVRMLHAMHQSTDDNLTSNFEAAANIAAARQDWGPEPLSSIWSRSFVVKLSHHPKLDGVICLGSVLAITLKVNPQDSGYASMSAITTLRKLKTGTGELGGILARPLGNVLYFMASQITNRQTADRVQDLIELALED